jgi:pyrroline-5-carboxylate reductase
MGSDLSVAFIGGGNMASALVSGLAGKLCPISRIHVVEVDDVARAAWQARGASTSAVPDQALAQCDVWIYAVKPQSLKAVAHATRPWLKDSLVISIAAGIRATDLARWLGEQAPWPRLVRCMPNTPSLIGQGVSGLAASPQVGQADRDLATAVLQSVGEVVWVDDEATLDGVTALSGSGPAYVFLLIEALIEGGLAVGLNAAQARELALATLAGSTSLAAQSSESASVLRERVTSKGGTTAAALAVMNQSGFKDIVVRAIQAAAHRAQEMGDELGQ